MENPEYSKKKFDFSDIFPQCSKGYKWENHSPTDSLAQKLTPLCSKFYNSCVAGHDNSSFSSKCQLVTFYLAHIKNKKNEFQVNPCCKYFFYKLWHLLRNYPRTCGDTKKCYEKMKTLISATNNKEEINELFSQCSNFPNDFDQDIFKIFEKLDIIYNALDAFTSKPCPAQSDLLKIRAQKAFLEERQNIYNDSFTKLLRNFNDLFKNCVKGLNGTKGCVVPFLSYVYEEEKAIGIIKIF
ncbi:variable surface protein, partial [Plasmodium gonderi]